MASEYLCPYVFPWTMDLWTPDEEPSSCCGACASIGFGGTDPDQETFRYRAHEALAIHVRGTGVDFAVAKDVVVVGRTAGRADLVLRDPSISRVQCRFVFAHGIVQVEDMGSACGTIVNGRQVTRTTLHEGDTVRVGDSELEVVRV